MATQFDANNVKSPMKGLENGWAHERMQIGTPKHPYVFQEYPKYLYKGARSAAGAEFTNTAMVNDPDGEAELLKDGFFADHDSAISAFLDAEQVAEAAAEDAAYIRAQAQLARAEASRKPKKAADAPSA